MHPVISIFLTLLIFLMAGIFPLSASLPSSASRPVSHTYDSLNRIATSTSVMGTITRTYQGTSSRVLSAIPTSGPKTLMAYGTAAEDFRLKEISNQTSAGAIISQHNYTFTWGLDLSGSIQGAGGVGGLLVMRWVSEAGQPDYFPTYDGNVSEYLSTTGANIVHYEYDPFGGLTRLTGNNSGRFQHRFSTKPRDFSTGLYYYGYRWYDSFTGRCPSRDPIEEKGGLNVYRFVGNNGISRSDYLGWDDTITVEDCEVKIVVGHGDRPQNTFWKLKGCSLGGFAGCFPGTNNPGVAASRAHDVPDGHDDEMAIGNGDNSPANQDNQKFQRDSWNENSNNPDYVPGERPEPKWEHGIPEALDNMTDPESIQKNVEKLCKCKCKDVKVTLELSDAGDEDEILEGINNRSHRFAGWDGSPHSKTYSCTSSGPWPFYP